MDIDSKHCELQSLIHQESLRLGFSACGFATVAHVEDVAYSKWLQWIADGKHDEMRYMADYATIRRNPQELLPDARTVISVALNYYPQEDLPAEHPRFARYAYGRDYHDVMRGKLLLLSQYIESISPCHCRLCCDTAPIFERYWAVKSGLGFIGRNSQLIIPNKGSYFFLGEILTTMTIPHSPQIELSCGDCRKCVDACPVRAIGDDGTIDARRCISCRTIENRNELPAMVADRLGKRVYGCDTCQEVCPHNKYAQPTTTEELHPGEEMKTLSYDRLKRLTKEEFLSIFRHSAVKRARYEGLMRNIAALDPRLFDK